MNITIQRHYTRLRNAGWQASHALYCAKAHADFDSLGEDNVRVRIVPDESASMDDVKGDCFNPKANPTISRLRLEREEKVFEERVEHLGVWGFIAEYRDPLTGKWEHADSCWGFVGEDDAYASGYAYDGMAAAVKAYHEATALANRYAIQAGRGIVRDGVHIASVSLPRDIMTGAWPIPPEECDRLARRVVELLNKYGEDD